jgi:hypothetical protein
MPMRESIKKHFHRIFAAAATLAGAVLMLTVAPAAFAMRVPPPDEQGGGAPAAAYIAAGGGMHGWQITLIAVGAALVAAAVAVLLDRARAARKARASTA